MSATHLQVVMQGSYRAGAASGQREIWQTGFRVGTNVGNGAPPEIGLLNPFEVVARTATRNEAAFTVESNWTTEMGISDLDVVDWAADQVAPAVRDFIVGQTFCADVQVDQVKIYPIRRGDGKVEPAPPYAQGTPCTITWKEGLKPSGGGAQGLPLNCSIVASLRTPQIGRAGRGRMFLPPAPTSYMSNLTLSSAAQNSVASAVRVLLQAVRLSVSVDGVDVFPIVTGGDYSRYAMVNRVMVGNVVDSQNRRRRSIEETYASTDVDPLA